MGQGGEGFGRQARLNTGPWLLLLQATALVAFTVSRPGLGTAGALLFLAAVFGVTVVINVPLNNRLAAGADWAAFAPRWVRWNLVRGVASALAALLMVPALVHGG